MSYKDTRLSYLKVMARVSIDVHARRRAYYRRNKERILAQNKRYRNGKKAEIQAYERRRYLDNRKKKIAYQKVYYKDHKKEVCEYHKKRRMENPENERGRSREWRWANIDVVREKDRDRSRNLTPKRKHGRAIWRSKNPDKINGYRTKIFIKARILLGNRCSGCGYDRFVEILEIDHKISCATIGVKRGKSGSAGAYEAIRAPDGFQLLCPNCHAIKTSLEKRSRNPDTTKAKMKYQRSRSRLIEEFGACCIVCGYDENPLAFEFDHIHPIWGSGRSSAVHHVRKNPELFQMLCANCHTLKTQEDFANRRQEKHLEAV